MDNTMFGNTSTDTRRTPSFFDMMRAGFERAQAPVQQIQEMDVNELAEKVNQGNAKILDVRTHGEFAQGHLENSVHFSLQEISAFGPAAETRIPFAKDDEIHVICRSGNRSAAAVNILNSLGYTNAYNVRGGIIAWVQNGLQITN
ncbi:MAG: rhodanese-like domain-containing protein [Spirochaetia bacterium]|nr:rhodanese-like domain-containing protein [Spirochaetia bacterium]